MFEQELLRTVAGKHACMCSELLRQKAWPFDRELDFTMTDCLYIEGLIE